MNDFTASNNVHVRSAPGAEGALSLHDGDVSSFAETIDRVDVVALREFFQAEADERLGRWRWPENPDYVVYPCSVKTRVRVLRESGTGDLEWVDQGDGRPYEFVHAARAYFDAHPEPKPAWHESAPWETWLITFDGVQQAVTLDEEREFRLRSEGGGWAHITSDAITAGRRIWPEVSL